MHTETGKAGAQAMQIQEGRVSFRSILQEVEKEGMSSFNVKGLIQQEFPGLEWEEEKLIQNINNWAKAHDWRS